MKSSKKQVHYDGFVFQVAEDVYEPAEDSFLVADYLTQVVKEDDVVLDVGTGCGILAVVAARKAKNVVATDINPHAVKCAKLNAKTNQVNNKMDVRLGDLFTPIHKTEKFDLIVFNAPYLPTASSEQKTWVGRAWSGGPTGRQLIDRFVHEAPRYLARNGRILLVQSSLADIDETLKAFSEKGLEARVVAEKKFAFETIVVVEAKAFI
jgi:release factor glutamine methyltransferase